MSRSFQSGSWLEALRTFSAFRKQLQNPALSVSAASSVAAPSAVTPYPDGKNRMHMYELVAKAQLFGPPGFRVSAENLRVLRVARWELMQIGSPRNKSLLLERILQLYTEAGRALFYDPVPSQAERQSLLLEQMQCLVEAKVAGVPLTARHYRHPLQAPQLSEIGADLPLVLLQELESAGEAKSGDSGASGGSTSTTTSSSREAAGEQTDEARELAAARLDCAVGLASSGYVDAALRLCTAEGFPYVVQQVSQMRRDGWKQAWALADAVPLSLLVPTQRQTQAAARSSSVESSEGDAVRYGTEEDGSGWLTGVLDAAVRRYKASSDPAVREWVYSFLRVWTEGKAMGGRHKGGERLAGSATAPVPLHVMEVYLTVCPASAWREALEMVLCYNSTGSPFPTHAHMSRSSGRGEGTVDDDGDADAGGGGGAVDGKVGMGRLMTLLNIAQQPEETLRLFYGSAFTRDSLRRDEEDGFARAEMIWCPSEEYLSKADLQHPATYNHAMMALARLGYWRHAVLFYTHLPPTHSNRFTHWTAARMFLQPLPSSSSSPLAPRYLGDAAVYQLCVEAIKRAWMGGGGGSGSGSDGVNDDDGKASPPSSPSSLRRGVGFPDAEAVFENLALWSAARGDWQTTVWLSNHAPHGCRYIKLIAIASLLRAYGSARVPCVATIELLGQFSSFSPKRRSRQRSGPPTSPKPAEDGAERDSEGGHGDSDRKGWEVVRQMDALLTTHDVSVKQVCLLVAFLANSAAAVQLLGLGDKPRDGKPDAGDFRVLRPEVTSAIVAVLGRHINGSQDGLDHAIAILTENFLSLRQRQGSVAKRADGSSGEDTSPAYPSLQRGKILPEVMQLVEGIADNHEESWRVVLQVLSSLGESQGLSIARAAPAMVSAGLKAEVAIRFLDA